MGDPQLSRDLTVGRTEIYQYFGIYSSSRMENVKGYFLLGSLVLKRYATKESGTSKPSPARISTMSIRGHFDMLQCQSRDINTDS